MHYYFVFKSLPESLFADGDPCETGMLYLFDHLSGLDKASCQQRNPGYPFQLVYKTEGRYGGQHFGCVDLGGFQNPQAGIKAP